MVEQWCVAIHYRLLHMGTLTAASKLLACGKFEKHEINYK
jgi:hypothetical protein